MKFTSALAIALFTANVFAAPAIPPPIERNSMYVTNPPGVPLPSPVSVAAGGTLAADFGMGQVRTLDPQNGALNVKFFAPTNWVWGTGDDSLYIQAAINAITIDADSGTVYLPRGRYQIAHPLTTIVGRFVTLRGETTVNGVLPIEGTVIKLANGANCDMLVKPVGSRVNIIGIAFDGNKANQVSTTLHGIWLQGTSGTIDRCTVADVCLTGVSGTAIQNDEREARFYRVNIAYSVGDGIVNTASSDTEFEDILSGFNGGTGFFADGANSFRINRADLFRNALQGLRMRNANNNSLFAIQSDANLAEGLLLESTNGIFAYRNFFAQCNWIVNNYPTAPDGTPTPYASGTWSNVRLLGDNTVDIDFKDCQFWNYEGSLATKPKYQLEDARPYNLANGLEGVSINLDGSSFLTTAGFTMVGPYNANLVHWAAGTWWLDHGKVHADHDYWSELSAVRLHVTDQLEANTWQNSAIFTNGGWQYTASAPAWFLQPNNGGQYLVLNTAPAGVAGNALGWNPVWTVTTNGWLGINTTGPGVAPIDVNGAAKANVLEAKDAIQINAYFDGGWKRRAAGAAYYLQPTDASLIVWTAPTAAANVAITWLSPLAFQTNGIVSGPGVSVSAGGDGLKLLGETASTLVQLDGGQQARSIANGPGALINSGAGAFSYVAGNTPPRTFVLTDAGATNWTFSVTDGITTVTHSP